MTIEKRIIPNIQKKNGISLNEQEEIMWEIFQTYSRLDCYANSDFIGLTREESISKIMEIINKDELFSKLAVKDLGPIIGVNMGRISLKATKKGSWKLCDCSFVGDGFYVERRVIAPKKIDYRVTGEDVREGIVYHFLISLLETEKFFKPKMERGEKKSKLKRLEQIKRIKDSDEQILRNLKERGYSYDIIREVANDPYLRLDNKLVEKVLSK